MMTNALVTLNLRAVEQMMLTLAYPRVVITDRPAELAGFRSVWGNME
jgi:hypothetical protein